MINYRYDFDFHTLDIIVKKALLQVQAIQYKDNTVFIISEEQYKKLIKI
jgi:hypothetical protein